jgi:hypothetical protein
MCKRNRKHFSINKDGRRQIKIQLKDKHEEETVKKGKMHNNNNNNNNNNVALVRKRTIPSERPPLVDKACVNFCG